VKSSFLLNSVVAVIAAAAGYAIYAGVFAKQAQTPAAAIPATAPPATQPATQSDEPATAIPQELPDFTLEDRDGAKRSIRSWTGKSMVVNFWATWCAPCRREIPLLKDLQKAHGDAGFQIVGVAVDFRDDVLKYADKIGIDYPILIGEQDGMDAVTKFGMGSLGFPFTVFTDNQQRIIATHVGELTKAQSDVLIAAVSRVNRGELTPATARVEVAKQLQALEGAASG
jgi:thiol-disulfide isomerase/thioredoxin